MKEITDSISSFPNPENHFKIGYRRVATGDRYGEGQVHCPGALPIPGQYLIEESDWRSQGVEAETQGTINDPESVDER